jgi:hypothetical protein
MGLVEARKYIQDLHKRQSNPYLWPDYLTGLPDKAAIIKKMSEIRSKLIGGPHWLDSFGAELRWKPPSLMPPVLPDTPVSADSSMPHGASCRPAMNEDALHCNG